MKKISYLFGLFVFTLFIPKVYAFTYELETMVSNLNVKKGTVTEIKVSLKNIKGTEEGIASCSLNIEFDSNIVLNSKISAFENWTLTSGNVYLLDTGEPIFTSSDLLTIPVKVNGNGSVELSNIECSDGVTLSTVDNKKVSFTLVKDTTNNDNTDDSDSDTILSSNCDLSDIVLSEGAIEFDPNVTDYYIDVTNYDNLIVEPVLDDESSIYNMEKNVDKKITINVTAEDGTNKKYTIFVNEKSVVNNNTDNESISNGNYTFVFIGIICILVLINIFRIVKNMKK